MQECAGHRGEDAGNGKPHGNCQHAQCKSRVQLCCQDSAHARRAKDKDDQGILLLATSVAYALGALRMEVRGCGRRPNFA